MSIPSPRRSFLRQTAALGLAPFAILPARPRLAPDVIGHGEYRYRVQQDWGPPVDKRPVVSNCHEMVMARDGRLFLMTSDKEHNILIFSKTGELTGQWTAGFGGGHGLTLHDEGGTEYLYLTDFAGQVVKCTLDGRVVLRLPDPRDIGAYATCESYAPTETAVGPDGTIYVADGYGSQYILRFSATGHYLGKFGGRSALQDDKFQQAHGVAIDYRGGGGPRVLCTARFKNAFKWFTLEGEYLETVYLPGAFVSRPVIDGDMLYSGVCFGMLPGDYRMHMQRGFVTILDAQNRVVSNPGGSAPRYADGRLDLMLQDTPTFQHCHDVCVDDEQNLYICQWNAGGVYPYKLIRS